jgi:hypothetical protein
VTTNSGPEGTELAGFCETNAVVKFMNRVFTNDFLMATFRYTNFDASEEIDFGAGMRAEFKDKSNNGYSVSFTETDDGTLLNYAEIKHGKPNGPLARFADLHP